jgi:hypothetical protein
MCLFFTFTVQVRTVNIHGNTYERYKALVWPIFLNICLNLYLYNGIFILLNEEIVNVFNSMIISKWRPVRFSRGGPNILLRPRIRSLCLFSQSAHLDKTGFSVRNKLFATSAFKNIQRRRRRKDLIWSKIIPPRKSYGASFWDYHWIKDVYYFFI